MINGLVLFDLRDFLSKHQTKWSSKAYFSTLFCPSNLQMSLLFGYLQCTKSLNTANCDLNVIVEDFSQKWCSIPTVSSFNDNNLIN